VNTDDKTRRASGVLMIADICDFSDYYNFVVYWTGTKQAPRQYNN